jgi:hypothetical protein
MAHRQVTLHRAVPPWDRTVARRHHHGGGTSARPLASLSASRPPSRSAQHLLRRQRSSYPGPGRRMTPPPNRRTVVGEGRSREASPYPDRLGRRDRQGPGRRRCPRIKSVG